LIAGAAAEVLEHVGGTVEFRPVTLRLVRQADNKDGRLTISHLGFADAVLQVLQRSNSPSRPQTSSGALRFFAAFAVPMCR
jgi:hypothetical protein